MTVTLLYWLGCALIVGPMLRHTIRAKKNVRGTLLSDICLSWWCPCCSLIQEYRELHVDGAKDGAYYDIYSVSNSFAMEMTEQIERT